MKNIILSVIIAILFFVVPSKSIAVTNVLYINGINNTLYDVIDSKNKIEEILIASENHLGSESRTFFVDFIWNPVGFHGTKEGEPSLRQDQNELFLLKTAEEMYGEDFQKIMVPFNESKLVDVEAAARVAAYLDDMTPGSSDPNDTITPGSNSLEAEGRISDDDMRGTQKAIQGIVLAIEELGSAVIIAHSQGNLLTNLAYAEIASDPSNDVSKMIRVVNVANTSEFSVNSLNFTHAGDAALYSNYDSLDASLETMPVRSYLDWRITPECDNYYSRCNFVIAPPTFEAYSGGGYPWLSHGFVDVYLSEDVVILGDNYEGVPFTPYAERFVDRFEDFVYAAAGALELAGVEPPVVEPPVGDYFKMVVGTVEVGDNPIDIAIADGYAYVTNSNDNSVSVIRLSDRTVIDTIPVGRFPKYISIADGYAYVTNNNDNSVSVIRLSDRTVIDSIPINWSPRNISIADGYAYVSRSNLSQYYISVIRLSDRTVIDSIPVNWSPGNISIANGYAYVVNSRDDSITILSH